MTRTEREQYGLYLHDLAMEEFFWDDYDHDYQRHYESQPDYCDDRELPKRKQSVYLMVSEGRFKIGVAVNVRQRLRNVRSANWAEVDLLARSEAIWTAKSAEAAWHARLKTYSIRGEWFHADPRVIRACQRMIQRGQIPRP